MGILQKIKSALGLDGATSTDTRRSGDVDVTVEREPSTEDEDAVKGTDTSTGDGEPADDSATDGHTDEAVTADAEAAAVDEAETADDEDGSAQEAIDEAGESAEADEADAEAEAAAVEADESTEAEGSPDPVTELNGIGPAYAERLSGQGIETVGELAVADPEAIAAETDLGAKRVSSWVEQAREY